MSIQPTGEDLRQAVKWINEMQKEAPAKSLKDLIQQACLKFDLSPSEAEFLGRTLKDAP